MPATARPVKATAVKAAPKKPAVKKAAASKPAPRRPTAAELGVFDPAYEAHRLRMTGMPWREVAAKTGYRNDTDAMLAVRRYLTKAATELDAEQKREALRLQLDRYEAVLSAWWTAATVGSQARSSAGVPIPGTVVLDDRAAAVVLKTLAQIDKLHNFDAEATGDAQPEIIVIGGNPSEYAAGLRAVIEAERT
jgi:hypothetical protein